MVANSAFSLQIFHLVAFADDEEHDLQAMAQAISGIEQDAKLMRTAEVAGITDDEAIGQTPLRGAWQSSTARN